MWCVCVCGVCVRVRVCVCVCVCVCYLLVQLEEGVIFSLLGLEGDGSRFAG